MKKQKFDGECEVCESKEGFLMRNGEILCIEHGTYPFYSGEEE
jgi:hypothetical protein